jgi:hypothetical protein
MNEYMRSIIFWSCAEYCDYATKFTIKHKGNQIRTELWTSAKDEIEVDTIDYPTFKKAYKAYKEMIGSTILGGWQVLNLYPQRETWETKRSK